MDPDALRQLPSVRAVAEDPRLADLPRPLAVSLARGAIDAARAALLRGDPLPDVIVAVRSEADALLGPRLRPVLNATGVVLHTNLGRAPWPEAVRRAAADAMGTCNVEIDLDSGRRGGRLGRIPARCRALVGCEDAVVVNNGAAALLLALTALGHGREVLVSRGELVEIGGSFRVPDVVAAGGARLVEVGTTNRTRAGDYRAAATDRTAVLLSVHPSNFVVRGFVASPTRAERVAVARILGVPVVEDVGSGDLTGARGEPSVAEAVAAGVDVVVFSGDKLLGGPQSGFAVGRAEAIGRLRAHPLYRALRLDKVLLAAVEATLAEHLAGRETPVDEMLSLGEAALVARAEALRHRLLAAGVDAAVRADEGATGGGARPDVALPGPVVLVRAPQVDAVARDLRLGEPAILARVADGALVLDPRTLPEEALPAVAARVAEAVVARYGAPR